jgi:hypothetical protein
MMTERTLAATAEEIPSLRAVFFLALPEGRLRDSWRRSDEEWEIDDAVPALGKLLQANREALQALRSRSAYLQITIESADALVALRRLSEENACVCLFRRGTPLGLVRLHLRQLVELFGAQPAAPRAADPARGSRLVELLQRYAPYPHAVLLRVSLRTGIGTDLLRTPEELSDTQVAAVELAAKSILGLEELPI